MMSVRASCISRAASLPRAGRRGSRLGRATAVAASATPLLGADLSVLSAAVEKAELVGALTAGDPLTVFAPSDAAFAKVCKDLQLSKEEVLELETLPDILAYHVVKGTVARSDLADGEVATLNERFSLDVAGATVNGANITAADGSVEGAANLTVHVIDEVLFPPWSAPAKVLTPQQILAFEGWAPEVINGRLAMLGFLTAQVQLWAFPSLAPAFSSNEGYTATPF